MENKKFDMIKENFVKVYTTKITIDIPIEKIYIHSADNNTRYIYNIDDITENERLNGKRIFKNGFNYIPSIKKIIHNDKIMKFSTYGVDTLFYPFSKESEYLINEINTNDIRNNIVDYFIRGDYKRSNFIGLLENTLDGTVISYYTNKKIYDKMFTRTRESKRNNDSYKIDLILQLLERNIQEKKTIYAEVELNSILNNPIHQHTLPHLELTSLKESVNLYNYQKADIIWMTELKNKIDKKKNCIKFEYNEFNKVTLKSPSDIFEKDYLMYNGQLLPNVANVENSSVNIYYQGGNIISSVGLGKTIITLGYLVHNFKNEYDCFISFENEHCNYFYKRGKNKGDHCQKKKIGELYCKEHQKTLFIDKRTTILNTEALNSFSLRENLIEIGDGWDAKKLFKSNASIIICPNQLSDQWAREYYDSFKQNGQSKRVLLIVTYDQYRNITFGEILFADIIIVSYDFLKNTNYLKRGQKSRWNDKKINIENILDEYDSQLVERLEKLDEDDINQEVNIAEMLSISSILNKFNVNLNVLDNFYYKNIIFDEYHEINSDVFNETLSQFKSIYKWNVTATPFANGLGSFINIINNITNNSLTDKFLTDKIDENIVKTFNNLFRRNTKESVKDEYNSVLIKDTLKLLTFTEQERRIYDAHSINKSGSTKDFLIKLCCDTSIDVETKNLVKNCKTLDEIEAVILNNNKKKLHQLKKKIDEYEKDIIKLQEHLVYGFDFHSILILTMEDLSMMLRNVRRSLTTTKKEYNDINRVYTFLKNAVDNIKTSETCPICLDDDCTDIAITKCGHKFCKDCIHEYVEEMGRHGNTKCPKCNIPIKFEDIYLLKEEQEIIVEEESDLGDLIQRVRSTKIGNIIYFIKNSLKETDKCIIFSQWDTLLSKIGNLLKAENISPLFCRGTVYQRKRSIKAFQEDSKSRFICLSSENCASGINLTAANKIILIEPIYGSIQHRIDTENQSIGRAVRLGAKRPVEVLRFIIKDSIEEDIYNDNEKELNYNIDTEPLELNDNVLEI